MYTYTYTYIYIGICVHACMRACKYLYRHYFTPFRNPKKIMTTHPYISLMRNNVIDFWGVLNDPSYLP